MNVGDVASGTLTVDEETVRKFADATGDWNPLHVDEDYASGTSFGRRIAHGMLIGSLISRLIATRLPGPGSIYLMQEFNFLAPAYIGDEVTGLVRILEIRRDKPIVRLETLCSVGSRELLRGEALVKYPTTAGEQ